MKEEWTPGKRVAIVGGGPAGISMAFSMRQRGYHVHVFERSPAPEPLGGAVLLSVPALAVLRSYGIDIDNFGSFTRT